MTELHHALANRFGAQNVATFSTKEGEIPLLLIKAEIKSPVTLLMTNGLSDYKMSVPEIMAGHEFNELYFCLPSYWDIHDSENTQMNWVYHWIQRLSKYVQEKHSWFGHGHTMPCGKEMKSLSHTMKENHFFLSNPMLLENELVPTEINNKTVRFLSIIPIFEDEMDYKQGKGTFKFIQKLRNQGVSEKLDDYRSTVMKSKWRLMR